VFFQVLKHLFFPRHAGIGHSTLSEPGGVYVQGLLEIKGTHRL